MDGRDRLYWSLTACVWFGVGGGSRSTTAFTKISGAEVIIFEGILAFHSPELNAMYDMKLFVDTDDDTRLIRRSTSLFLFAWLRC